MLTRKIRQNIEILFIFARIAPTGKAIKKRGLATLRLNALLWRGLVNVYFRMSTLCVGDVAGVQRMPPFLRR